jgi:parallel beta-helix repeat protein
MDGRHALLAVGLALLVAATSFAFPVRGAADEEPVAFEDTISLGLTASIAQQERARDLVVPKVQAYYSGYRYVVGYYSVESYLAEQRRTGHDRQFGQPISVFVTDFAGTGAALTDRGYLTTDSGETPAFVPADETVVVVGSEARTPVGGVAVPFSERSAAAAFAQAHGGEVVPWSAVPERVDAPSRVTRERFESRVDARARWADAAAAAARSLRERPVSVVVGEDEPTLAAAVAAAPANTTVRLPPGTYRSDGLAVEKPLTIDGVGPATRISGDGNGTVLRVNATDVAVTDLRIDGVGPVGSKPPRANGSDPGWSELIELAYGRGAAAVKLDGADGALIEDVLVDTPASGIITRNATGAVVSNLTLRGTDDPYEGFMGIVAMYGPLVVEDSTFVGGRDAVYTHRADGTVVRDSRMRDARFGVHLMYTSGTLLRNNTVRNESTGIVVMTRPAGNLVVDNRVRDSGFGLSSSGSASYYARNVVVDNEYGIDVSGTRSLYAHNTVVGNDYGLRGSTLLPTNLVTANDVLGNGRAVESELGPLRVWTVDGEGNYWGSMPARDEDGDGFYERSFHPTGPVDAHLHDAVGARTLARSPAVALARRVQGSVPGLRPTGVVDVAPRVSPARPAALAAASDRSNATTDREVGA